MIGIMRVNNKIHRVNNKLSYLLIKEGIELITQKSGTFAGTLSFATSQTVEVDWGDGSIDTYSDTSISLSHNYIDASIKEIKITSTSYNINEFNFNSQEITDAVFYENCIISRFVLSYNNLTELDLSNIKLTNYFFIHYNSNLTNIIHSTELGQSVTIYLAYSCDLTGTLDLSNIKLTNKFEILNNPNLTEIIHSTELGQSVVNYIAYNCNLTGTLDLSNIKLINNFKVYYNANLTNIIHSTESGQELSYYHAGYCNLSGTLNLSNIKLTDVFRIYYNTNLTNIIHSTELGQNVNNYYANGCDLAVLEFEKLEFIDSCLIEIKDNNMTTAEVNENTVKVAGLGKINGSLSEHGTNSAPDSSSGGFDGTQAVADLQANGWTVTTS